MSIDAVSRIVMIPIDKIVPYEKNPRRNSKTVELLCKAIPKVGFNVPLVLDRNNVIVKGHARWLAAKQLGMTEVPCVISFASPEMIKADRIADNKVFEFSQWVKDELLHEVDMLDIGFDLKEFDLPTVDTGVQGTDFGMDFEPYEEEEGQSPETEEERRRRFAEFMAKQEQEAETPVQITTQQQLDSAKQKLKEEHQKGQANYLSITCEKCGHVFYVREGDAMTWE